MSELVTSVSVSTVGFLGLSAVMVKVFEPIIELTILPTPLFQNSMPMSVVLRELILSSQTISITTQKNFSNRLIILSVYRRNSSSGTLPQAYC